MSLFTQSAPALLTALLWTQTTRAQAPVPIGDDRDRRCRDAWLAFGCSDRPWEGPRVVFGVGIGVSAMNESGPFGFDNGVGSVTEPGPSWAIRIGVEMLPWVAVEASYLGMYDSARAAVSPGGSVGFLTTGADAVVRLTAPLPYVHPYAVGGAGYYDVTLAGSSSATGASVVHSSSQPALVVGFGVDVPLTWHVSVGAEGVYHHQSNETYSSVTTNGIDGGDLTTFDVVIRARP